MWIEWMAIYEAPVPSKAPAPLKLSGIAFYRTRTRVFKSSVKINHFRMSEHTHTLSLMDERRMEGKNARYYYYLLSHKNYTTFTYNSCISCMQFSIYWKWLPIYFMHFHWSGLSTRSLIAELKFDTARKRDVKSHESQWMNCQQLKQFASASCTLSVWLLWFAWDNPIYCFFSCSVFQLWLHEGFSIKFRGFTTPFNSISMNYEKDYHPLNFIFNTSIRKTINNS